MSAPLAAAVLAAAVAGDAGAFDLVVDAPAGPVRVRVTVSVDRAPLAEGPVRYRAALLGRLDGDGDGAVSAAEAASAPTPRVLGGGGDEGAARDAVDDLLARFAAAADRGAAGLPAGEFGAWVAGVMGPPVRAAARTAGGAAADVLALLDADGDGRLAPDELAAGAAVRRDFDADGTLSAAELAPFRDPAAAGGERRQFPAGSPFRLDPDPPADAAPDLEVAVSLVARSFGLPKAVVTANRAPGRLAVTADRRGFAVAVDGGADGGVELIFAADRPASVGADAVSLGLLELVRADGDANGYLDPTEFSAAGLPGAPRMGDVDRDGDEQATREEVRAYLEEDVRLAGSRAYVLAEAAAGGLFAALDRDGDGRLTPAERTAAAGDLAAGRFAPDRNGDGTLAAAELAGRYELHVGVGRPAPPADPAGDGMRMEQERPEAAPAAGPAWFRRSDRNGDGAVTWPEFVGPRSAFWRFDADADGSLTPAEAAGG